MTLYAPIYLSSHCENSCRYCGFAATRRIRRRQLDADEAVREARAISAQGIRHVLLVTGDDRRRYGLAQISASARAVRAEAGIASVAVEIFACDRAGYARLVDAGVDGLALYQETYQRERYASLHPAGPKKDFEQRLAAVEAGGQAGFRSLGVGALLGLAPPRVDAVYLALHAEYLTRAFPGQRVAVSLPRLRPLSDTAAACAAHRVSDADLVQFILGMRLLLPDAEIVLSTRESARLRDAVLGLGVTRMSAGSCTVPGGYSAGGALAGSGGREHGQFATDDRRSVAEVKQSLRAHGLDAVTKDFDDEMVGARRCS